MSNKIKNVVLNEQGAIVVEATNSLTAFMFLIVTILSALRSKNSSRNSVALAFVLFSR